MTPIRLSRSASTKFAGQSHLFSRFVFFLFFAIAFLVPDALRAQTTYEADASANTLGGTAAIESCSGCLDGNRVGNIGNGSANFLTINGINAPTTGTYVVALYYTEGTDGGARSFSIEVNGAAGPTLSNLTGSSWTAPAGPVIFEASFTAGTNNSVEFLNASASAPDVDHITVSASPLGSSSAPTTLSPTVYEADANTNIFGGSATVESCAGCLDGNRVGMLGNGSVNALTIKGITVPSTGVYSVTLYYVEGSDGGGRTLNVTFGDGSRLSLNNLSGGSWSAPAAPVTFLANFTAGSGNSLQFLNASGPAPDVDHIVVTGSASGDAGVSDSPSPGGSGGSSGLPGSGNSTGDGSNGFAAPQDLAQYLVNDYIPQGWCVRDLGVPLRCTNYYYDRKTNQDSADFGTWRLGLGWDATLPIQSSTPDTCWAIYWCYYQPQYFNYSANSSVQMTLPALGISGLSNGSNSGVTFMLRQYTVPHQEENGNDITGDVVTAVGTNGSAPIFSIRESGNRWALHSYQQALNQAPANGFDEVFWEPYTYPGNVPLYEDIYFTFTPDGRLTVDKFTPYHPTAGTVEYNWEESVSDTGWPFSWNANGPGSRVFTQIGSLVIGGVNGNLSNVDGFRELKVFNTAFTSAQIIEAESNLEEGSTLTGGMVPCNTGQWMNSVTVQTPCGSGGDGTPVPLPLTNIVTSDFGLTPATESYAPTSFTADDTNFSFTFSYSPPSSYPPMSEIQDPSTPPSWAPFYPVSPVNYTLYLLTQDASGLHSCQADLSQVGGSSNPGGNILEAALGADYPLLTLNGPDTIATTAWVNPNPQNFTGTITVPAGWQCTGGQLSSSGGGVISGNNGGSSGSSGSGSSSGAGPTINTSGWYNVVNLNSQLCLDVYQMGTALGTALDQWQCGDGQANQQWQFTSVGNGIYQISSRYVAMSWNVTGGTSATSNSVPIQLWSYAGSSNAQWQAVLLSTDSNGNGIYKFIAQNSKLCLDVPSASMSDGKQLDQYSCNGTNAQSFTLVPVTPASASPVAPTGAAPPPTPSPNPNSWYNVVNVNDGSCVDGYLSGTALGTVVDQWTCGNGQANQQWQFTPTGNGSYQVSSRYVSMSWNVTNNATTGTAPIQLWSYAGNGNEQWNAIYLSTDSNGNNVYQFVAKNSGLCLDVPGAASANGLQLDQYTCNGTNAQAFTLVQVTPASVTPVAPTAAAPPPPPQPNSNLWYNVVNVDDGSCLDVFNWGTSLGTSLDQWACGNGQANQQWQFTPAGNGAFQVSSRFVSMSWNVTGGATSTSTPIELWSYAGNSNEKWNATYLSTDSNGNNIYKFTAQNSGLCLDVPGAAKTNGLQLDQFTCNGTNAQAFTLVQVAPAQGNPVAPTSAAPPPTPQPNPSLWYNVVNVNDGSCVDGYLSGTVLGTVVDQWACGNGQANQQWQFTPTGNGIYQVSSRYVSMSWNVTGGTGATGNSVPIELWSYSGNSNEQWQAVFLYTNGNGNNVYKFIAQNSGLCLDVPGAANTNGLQLDQYACNGSNAQAFTLVQTTPASVNQVQPTAPAPPPPPQPNASQWYEVVNVNDGSCLDVLNFGTALGTPLDQWTCGSGQANQQWQFTPTGQGSFSVSSRFVNMSWNVTGGVGAGNNQAPIQLWSYGGNSNEQWQAQYLYTNGNGNNVYRFIAQNDGHCLDVPGAANTNGLQLDQFSCNGTNAQAFTLVPVTPASGNPVAPTTPAPPPTPQPNSSAWYEVVNVNDGSCLDVYQWETSLGTSLDQWTCGNGQANQQWQFTPTGQGSFSVSSRFVNMSWNVTGGVNAWNNRTPIQLWSYGGASNEQWKAVYLYTDGNNNSVYRFVAQNDGLCLDVPGAASLNGLQLDQYSCNGTKAQAFTLVQVNPAGGNPVAPTSPQPTPNLWYNVVNVNDGSCVEDYSWGTALGSVVDQWTCGNGQANQQWQFTPTGKGTFSVSSRFVAMSWNVKGGNGATGNQTPIQLWSYGGAGNEQWNAVYLHTDGNGNNVYKFVDQNEGLCLDVPGSSSQNGQQLDQYSCNGTNAQSFTLVEVFPAAGNPVAPTNPQPAASNNPPPPPPPPSAPVSSGARFVADGYTIYQIQNVGSNLCVDIYGGAAHGNLTQWGCNIRDGAQQWSFICGVSSCNSYVVRDNNANYNVWDVAGGTSVTWDGAGIDVYDNWWTNNEQWASVQQGDGSYNFVSVSSGKCLDVPGSSHSAGVILDQWDCNGTDAQKFWVNRAPESGGPGGGCPGDLLGKSCQQPQ